MLEFRIDEVSNALGRDAQGDCCSGREPDDLSPAAACPGDCKTFAALCVGHYQTNVSSATMPCTFGEFTTPVLGRSSFKLRDGYKMPIRFNHSWTVSGTPLPPMRALVRGTLAAAAL